MKENHETEPFLSNIPPFLAHLQSDRSFSRFQYLQLKTHNIFFKCREIFAQNFKGENIYSKEKSLWKLSEMRQLGVIA